MRDSDVLTIFRIQQRLTAAGFIWRETIFNDGLGCGECSVHAWYSTNPHITEEYAPLGWGRFTRLHAWLLCEEFLNEEFEKWRLREEEKAADALKYAAQLA